jgi:gluconokinase
LIHNEEQAVIACSALREIYRTSLQVANDVKFVYLKGSFELIRQRLLNRQNHFMTVDLLTDQFSTLEEPADALSMDISLPPGQISEAIRIALGI